MPPIIDEVIGGLVVAILSAIGGFLFRMKFFSANGVLPRRPRKPEKESYSHLNGKWHLYFLTRASSVNPEPFWIHGNEELRVIGKNEVAGTTHIADVNHPSSGLNYEVHGEIRHGKMILTDNCLEDETEFASIIIPNLRSAVILIGIWTGFDNDVHLVSGPVILSRTELSASDLNQLAKKSTMGLIPMGPDYRLYGKNGTWQ